ncbi:cytochrome c oxidase subunit II [Sphingomonas sanxanigenens]|uniref:Cytochrome oxidase subunit II copper A binding domain-containing protein n=2 Tax=Sphingomonadaceae TaxID=41297 RepID=W0A920_9SPHN|nr:hypothetical protein [Sphingomonas sanxanigenens]AHE52170.1 hypothetical protein NX02_02045 [Sphingomonas sanxanigenens DSM 19645 = NX02]
MSTLDAHGPGASGVATLWWVMLAGAAALTILVLALLALSFRRRGPGGKGGDAIWLGWLGVAMPGAVLAALLGYALVLGNRSLPRAAPDLVVVHATGQQWQWTFRQPGASTPILTRGTLHIPVGRPVDVHLVSADVIHSFWVPRLGGKMDAIPGQVNVLRIVADRPGLYEGQCAEFCGLDHASHRFRVIAHDAAGWAAFRQGAGQ